MFTVSFDTTVRGGFPVTVDANIYPADRSVGINRPYVDDFFLYTTKGKRAKFLEHRLTDSDIESIHIEALSYAE